MKLSLFLVWVAVLFSCSEPVSTQESGNRWEGQWLRVDGNYRLILEEKETGSFTATYLNPRPINVRSVQIQVKGEREHLVVILNDVGYPGAVYDLVYSTTADRLVGTYINPNAGQTYDVSFTRQP
ncbi:MAG: hypothetical protein AAF571_03290 [Verrucomicrobiota bacterium]